jgi:hypothetical protein
MSILINKNGDLVITVITTKNSCPIEELDLRRGAIYNAIQEHNSNEFIGSDIHYGLTELLKDLDPTPQQWKKLLKE